MSSLCSILHYRLQEDLGIIQKGLTPWMWEGMLVRMGRDSLMAEPLGGGNLKSFADFTQPSGSAYATAF